MNRLALRLAARQLGQHRASTLLTIVSLAVPIAALIAVNVVASNSVPSSGTASNGASWVASMMGAATIFALPVAIVICVMVASAFFVSTRRNERMLALLESIGAPPQLLFRVVFTAGILVGTASALLAAPLGALLSWVWLGRIAGVNLAAVIAIATTAVVLGAAASVFPALRTGGVDLRRALSGTPRPVIGPWRAAKTGRIVVASGIGMALVGAGGTGLVSLLTSGETGQPSHVGMILSLIFGSLTQLGPFAVIGGLLLTLPALFRRIGGLVGRLGTAPRLAARDAERGWARSVPAAASIMVVSYVIGAYLTMFGMNATLSVEQHGWSAREGQALVGLIDADFGESVLDPQPLPDPEAIARAIDDTVGLDEWRVLKGAQGPYYGHPVDDSEGFSGRQEIAFPPEGLPLPRISENNACDGELPAWRCSGADYSNPHGVMLSPIVPTIWVGDAADLALILGTVDPATASAFARGDALVFSAEFLAANNTVTLDWFGPHFIDENEPGEFLPAGPALRSETVPGHLVPLDHRLDYGILLNETSAEAIGLTATPARLLGNLPAVPAFEQQQVAADAVSDAVVTMTGRLDAMVWPEFQSGPPEPDRAWSWGALIIAGGIALAVSLTAVGLARVEGRAIERTLATLGADPGIRRTIAAWYALLVTGVATAFGTAIGVAQAYAITTWFAGMLLPVPVLEPALLAFGVPIVAAAIAWCSAGGRRQLR